MSLQTLAESAVARSGVQREVAGSDPFRESLAKTSPAAATASDAAAQLTKYVPTELIAPYTAATGLLAVPATADLCDASFLGRWVLLVAFLVLTPIAVFAAYRATAPAAVRGRLPVAEMAIATFAFVAWATVLPLSPAWGWCWWQPQFGTIVGIVALVALGIVGPLLLSGQTGNKSR